MVKQAQKVWKISTREKENSGYKGQTKTDSEATKPQVPTISGFPVTWRP